MTSRFLIRHAHAVFTGLRGAQARSDATDLRIAEGLITEMGRGLHAQEGERVLDASDCVVYPGWVNTHHHLFQSLLKGVPAGIDATLSPWLQAVPFAFRRGFDEQRLRVAARIGLVELLRSGCTTVADHHYLFQPGADHDAAALLFEEAEALGMRFMLLRGGATVTRRLEDSERLHQAPETLDQMLAAVEQTAARFHQRGPGARRRVAMAPTSVHVSLPREQLKVVARAARALGLPLHSHMSESVAYIEYCREVHGCRPIEYLANNEWLGPDVWLAHLVHLSPGEMKLLGDSGTGIAHCPQSNARLADGIAPAPALERLGVPVSIGVDGAASNEAADMISELHFAWLVHRAQAGALSRPRPEGEGEAGGDAVTVEQLVHWATAGGAGVLGFEGVGTLQVGQAADLAVFDLDDPRYFGLHDPGVGPIVSGGRPRLRWLLCGGEVVAEDDGIPGLDLGRLRAQAGEEVRALMRAG
ncbi:amidohydrolase family protein [Variovorax guangxiensis]|uniref:amidohydrolase family protein n=1 Tax=Variovorax guangxiensis TaxID=1775474 RepID=UPI00285E8908|nr:amidohydrolase family protein [Variovorax guangxiensis]MDR6853854.1 cytosine/adenosine deaminase-related metal-dependent hydrolase [Variovorax guangxiensis]